MYSNPHVCVRAGCPCVWTGGRAPPSREGRYSTCSGTPPHHDKLPPLLTKRPSHHGGKSAPFVHSHSLRIYRAYLRWSTQNTHALTQAESGRAGEATQVVANSQKLARRLIVVSAAIDCRLYAGVSPSLHVLYFCQPSGRVARSGGVLCHVRRGAPHQASARVQVDPDTIETIAHPYMSAAT